MSTSTLERTPSDDSLFLAALREPHTEIIEKPFTGFYDKFNFTVSVLALLTFGAIVNLLSIFPCYPTSLIGTIGTVAFSIWYNLHGRKMTRNELLFLNVSNMLEVEHTEFRFGLPANDDDCLTPGDGEQREAPQPQTLWDALFTDEKSMQMERFYKKHYGGVHANATKALMEYEAKRSKKEEKSQKLSVTSTAFSTSKSL